MAILSLEMPQGRFEEARKLLAHIPGGAEKAVARALNRAMEGARTEAARLMKDRYTMKVGDFKKQFVIVKASPGNLVARIMTRGARVAVTEFKHTPQNPPRQKGIPVAARKKVTTEIVAGQTKGWSHAFLARMKSGHLGLWTRSNTETTKKGKALIHEFFSLGVPHMFGYGPIIRRVVETASERLDKELDHQIQFLLSGGN
ncbi:MAG: hypothetical protein IJU98_02845 [Synergistaceae bacterium]|nr:hypothetical protein [Synergistaceae bacterium]